MRKFVAHILCATIFVGVSASATGCVVKAGGEVKAGGTTEPAKEVKPPPPDAPPPEKEKPKPAMNFEVENGQLKLPGPVMFETGKSVLKPESDAVLDVVKQYLEAKPAITLLRIEGHTDNVGTSEYNLILSKTRAAAVRADLIKRGGVDADRLTSEGFGATRPLVANDTPEGRARNRRVEIHIVP